jgi:hypothetical protein
LTPSPGGEKRLGQGNRAASRRKSQFTSILERIMPVLQSGA